MNFFTRQRDHHLRILNWLLVVLWMLLIFSLSSRSSFPVDFTPTIYKVISSLFHVFLYAVLTWLLIRSLIASGLKPKRALFYSFLIVIIYGSSDEWHQSFIPGREMALDDWLIDAVSSLAIIYYYSWRQRLRLK